MGIMAISEVRTLGGIVGLDPGDRPSRSRMASEPQSATPQTIPEVLLSIEARSFWERVYVAALTAEDPNRAGGWVTDPPTDNRAQRADTALASWRSRFGPKAGE